MPLLLLLLLSSAEASSRNKKEEVEEETVTEYYSAFINITWVDNDRQVNSIEVIDQKLTTCCRFLRLSQQNRRQEGTQWQGRPACRAEPSCSGTQVSTWTTTSAATHWSTLPRRRLSLQSRSAVAASLT